MHKAAVGCLVVFGLMILVYLILILIYGCQGSNERWEFCSEEGALGYLQSKIKGVYGLTLKRNLHKTQHLQNVMGRLGLDGQVWYGYDAKEKGVDGICDKGTRRSSGELGCSLSHLAIWKDILSKRPCKHDWYLILEDDADPEKSMEETHKDMAEGLKRSIDDGYRLIYFGFMSTLKDAFKAKRLDSKRWEIKCGGTHAYCVRADLLPQIISLVESKICERPVDMILSKDLNEKGVSVATDPYHPCHFFKQFLAKRKGIFGQKRDERFLSDIHK